MKAERQTPPPTPSGDEPDDCSVDRAADELGEQLSALDTGAWPAVLLDAFSEPASP